jgi:neutral ceramidase
MAFYVGRGISDITGEAADCGMLGYGMADQQTAGIHLRQRSRAFIFAESFEAPRILLVVNEIPLLLESIHQSVLAELQALYGDRYGLENTMLTATHTHFKWFFGNRFVWENTNPYFTTPFNMTS